MVPDLTTAQKQAVKADIAANTNTVLINGTPTAINVVPVSPDNAQSVADWYNLQASPNFFGNYATVPASDIFNAITWKNLTPADAVPTTPDLTVQVWMARNAMCQTLQMNVQTMLLGRDTIDATKGKIRSGFQDSLSSVPSGASGASQDAGWAAVQKILCRKLSNVEKLLADTSGGNGGSNTTAATCTAEGQLSGADVLAIWAS